MFPAFRSTARAALFGGVLLVFLTLPVILHWIGGVSREEEYRGISERAGAFDFVRHKIFDEDEPLDIAFCGNSLLGGAIHPKYVEQALSQALGRRARVELLPQSWQGPDMNYFVLRDLVENRPVKMMVIAAPAWVHHANQPHVQLFRVVGYGEHPGALDGLDFPHRAAIYADFVLGAPRRALDLIRPNRLNDTTAAEPEKFGTAAGYRGAPFVRREVHAPVLAPESMIYSEATRDLFRFDGPPLNGYQLHFIRKTAELGRQHHIPLVILHMPSPSERGQTVVPDRQLMPEVFGPGVIFAGIPAARMFEATPDSDYLDYFHDEHVNTNGMELYTKTITPALVEIYRRQVGEVRR